MKKIIENKWYYYRLSNKQLLFGHFGDDIANHILKTVPDHTIDWFKFSVSGKFLMVTDHNPMGAYEKYLENSNSQRIKQIQEELESLGSQKPQYLIDDDDEYQEQLELGWHIDELQAELNSLLHTTNI